MSKADIAHLKRVKKQFFEQSKCRYKL